MRFQRLLKTLFAALMLMGFALTALAQTCGICGQPITDRHYWFTDNITHQRVIVCSKCFLLPRCYVCGLPVKDGMQLSDGRWFCTRDAKTAVLDGDDVQQTFGQVHDYLDRLYARFTSFPTNVDVSAINRTDVNLLFKFNSYESPNVLGVTHPVTIDGVNRYKIGLLSGQPLSQLEEVCAHELSHAWVGENVSPERHRRIDRDAEEGFCEMMGYLLMDAMGEEGEKQRVMENTYTRGQVELFVEAEQQYGFEEILDWMRYGVTGRLEEGHLNEVNDVKMPVDIGVANFDPRKYVGSKPPPPPSTLQLQGIMWGPAPSAIINGHSFFAGDESKVPVGKTEVTIRCLGITQTTVQIQNVDSGKKEQLQLAGN